jgi:isoleucyl-tRNA synthetase
VNKVQNLRKDKDFKVLDRIKVKVIANEILKDAILNFHAYIANEILAKEIEVVDTLDSFDELEYNDETIKVFVAVV